MEGTRDKEIVVYLTDEEKQQIRKQAAENGEQISPHVRRKALQKTQEAPKA